MPLVTRTASTVGVVSQAEAPEQPEAGMIWCDINTNLVYRRNDANDDWNVIGSDTTVDATEYGYLNGVTSPIQTQINAKVHIFSVNFDGGTFGAVGTDQYFGVNTKTMMGNADKAKIYTIMPVAGTLKKFYVSIITNASTTDMSVYIVKNGNTDAPPITVTAGNTGTFSELTNTVSMAAGDSLAIATTGISVGNLTAAGVSLEYMTT